MPDQPIGLEFGDWDVGVAEFDADDGDAGAAGDADIGTCVTDDICPPARATVCCKITGSGFATPKVSAPQIAANRGLRPN